MAGRVTDSAVGALVVWAPMLDDTAGGMGKHRPSAGQADCRQCRMLSERLL